MSSERRRLHPAAFLAHAVEGFGGALAPLVVLFGTSGPSVSSGLILTALGGAFALVTGYLRWRSTSYWWTPTTLHLRSGIFSPDEHTIPLARIAAVDDQQGVVQRLCGVVAVHVQTAGGGRGEIRLAAVSHADADALRAAIGHSGPGIVEGTGGGDLPGWSLSRGGLVVAAITGPQLGVIAPLVGGAVALLSHLFQGDDAQLVADIAPRSPHGWILLGLASLATVLVLSLAGAVVGFAGFRAEIDGTRLRIRRGLLQRRAASVSLDRVLAVRIDEGSLRRPFGLCSVRLEVAGYADEPAVAQTLIPLCRRDDVPQLLQVLVPRLPLPATAAAHRPPARARRRYVVPAVLPPAVLVAVVLGVVADVVTVPALTWLVILPAAAAGGAVGLARFRDAAWWREGDVVAVRRRRLLVRSTLVAKVPALQHRALHESVLQRRASLASVAFVVASGGEGSVAQLEVADARRLFAGLT